MSDVQIMNRILSYHSEVNSQNIRSGNIDKNIDYGKIANCASEIADLKLKIDTNTKYVEDLESEIRVLKYKNEVDLIIIDYLTLLKSRGKYASRELEVSDISRKLKLLSLELDIPIIILVQLNRDAENREPTMANIRESGTIEQNCDNIIFLHNASGDDKSAVTNIQITLAKQRQGTTGRFELTFDKRYSKFKPKEEQSETYKRYPTKSN